MSPGAATRRGWGIALVASGLAAATVVAICLFQNGEHQRQKTDAHVAGTSLTRDGSTAAISTRSREGARASAVAMVTMGQRLLDLAPTQLASTVEEIAAAETLDRHLSDLEAQLKGLRATLVRGHGRTRYLQAVLATRVDAFDEARARVTVWSVGVLWRQGAADPQAGWTTSVVELVWEQDGWKLWDETTSSGPAPAPNAGTPPVDAEALDRLLVGFESWPAER